MSRTVTSSDVFSAMSVKILPPARNVSLPRVLALLQRIGLLARHKPPIKLLNPWPRFRKVEVM